MAEEWVDLASAIGQLRAQLAEARGLAEGEDLLFTVGKAEIELAMEVCTGTDGKAGFKFGVVSFDGGAQRRTTATHRLRLELLPHSGGAGIDIGDETADLPNVPG